MRIRTFALALGVIVLASCKKKEPEVIPTPTPPPASPAPAPAPPPPPPATNGDAAAAAEHAEVTRLLQQAIYFDLDQFEIRAQDRPVLDQKAAILQANPSLRIRIAGHADERGSDEYNMVLGTRRATAAKRYLETRGIDGSRIEIISYGEERPANPASNEAAWAQNRRDEFEIISGGARLVRPR
ncbi:MAG: peptidoglycan-associated lipoprotein Pal [Gemmatimonadales bacterium]|nr:peptidoglycan-associated lipoprotein Pal [Gemmatimonadales bacterium]